MNNTHVISHSILADRLTIIRDKKTKPFMFRHAMNEIAVILGVEATRKLPTQTKKIETPLTSFNGEMLDGTPLIVPILRAGLALSESLQKILPHADTGHIGLARDHDTHEPLEYLNRLPADLNRPIFVVDPMLATAGSLIATLDTLTAEGADIDDITVITVVCAPEGLEKLRNKYPKVHLYTAAIDSHLNDNAYIVPGLGDAGDRYFGTE